MKSTNKKNKDSSTIFMGLSIFKPRFLNKKNLQKDIDALKRLNINFFFLIADTPERYNLTTLEKLTKHEADQIISAQKDIIVNNIQSIDIKIKIIAWQQIKQIISPYIDRLEEILSHDNTLKKLITKTVIDNLSRRYPFLKPQDITTVSMYLIEELAQTWCFFDTNIANTEAYPGAIPEIKKVLFMESNFLEVESVVSG